MAVLAVPSWSLVAAMHSQINHDGRKPPVRHTPSRHLREKGNAPVTALVKKAIMHDSFSLVVENNEIKQITKKIRYLLSINPF